MDPNLLNKMEYSAGLNATNVDSGSQPNAESASASAAPPVSDGDSLWDPTLALGMSDEVTPAFLYAQENLGGIPYGGYGGPSKTAKPADAIEAATAARNHGGHDRKRAKLDSDAAALDSVDYWIHLDDDDRDSKLGGSFEIDFSGQSKDTTSFARPMPAFNTMSSTPGLGTGLYTTPNPSFFRAEDFIDDSALDHALSDDEDGVDSLNLGDQLSKIDSAPPTDVPPREGLYSTPLSWEKPRPGLRSDPLLSSFASNTPFLSDMEQQNLLAIALNTNRPPPANFGAALGSGYGFGGVGYDVLGGGFPTLGANALLESLGSSNLNDSSRPAEQPRPTTQPQPGPQPQAPLQRPIQAGSAQSQQSLSGQVQHQQPQGPRNQQRGQGQQVHRQPQHGRQTQGPASQTLQPPPKPKSPAQEQDSSAAQARQAQSSRPQGDAHDPTQPREPTVSEKGKNVSTQGGAEAGGEKPKEKAKSGDRAAHNDIERKYRTNLKDRISELRDSVPALRAIPDGGEEEEGAASQRHPKVSKGTVLTKATEYIHLLERKNKAIMREHQELSKRLQAFEQLLNATARQPFPMPSYSRTLFDPRGFC